MRIVRPLPVVVLVAFGLALAGCDSSQPDRIQVRKASLSFNTQASVALADCYEIWLDTSNPLDGTPDEFFSPYCEPLPGTLVPRPVAWPYSVSISVIKAGSTAEEIVGSSIQPQDGINDFVSLTDYDPRVETANAKDPADNVYYLFPKRVSVGSSVYANVGTPNLLNVPTTTTYDFDVDSGDTIIVRARKQSVAAALPPNVSPDQISEITLSAELAVGGVAVAVTGPQNTGTADRAGMTFSFTVQ